MTPTYSKPPELSMTSRRALHLSPRHDVQQKHKTSRISPFTTDSTLPSSIRTIRNAERPAQSLGNTVSLSATCPPHHCLLCPHPLFPLPTLLRDLRLRLPHPSSPTAGARSTSLTKHFAFRGITRQTAVGARILPTPAPPLQKGGSASRPDMLQSDASSTHNTTGPMTGMENTARGVGGAVRRRKSESTKKTTNSQRQFP